MSESQVQKKNKKARHKSETNTSPVVTSINEDFKRPTVTLSSDNNLQNLSKDTMHCTHGNIEATVTLETKPENNESANKKKKKSKKKSKLKLCDVLKETFPENNKPEPLLNFSANGIQLVNHPEISVTITDPSQSKDEEPECVTDKIPPFDEEKQTDNSAVAPSKKKKKKKKKTGDNVPVETATSNEPSFTTPSYTKVVTSDNTCVLVVNNENFSVDSKSLENSEDTKNKTSENSIDFSLPSEKQLGDVLLTKNFTPDTNIIKFNNAVSIFPVLTNEASDVQPQTAVNVNHNLETMPDDSKTNISESSTKENLEDSKPTKSQLKAERRAKQEAQRAAKLAKSNMKSDTNSSSTTENKNNSLKEKSLSKETGSKATDTTKEKTPKLLVEKESLHKMKLFSHLPQCKQFDINAKIHPAILEVGFQYSEGIICGANARCIAFLDAFKEVINDYIPQPDKNVCRDLESNIQVYLSFLNNCRPLSVSIINAVKFLKHQINHMPSDMDISQIKINLCEYINNFVREEILLAKEAICNCASIQIVNGDVILVFGHSSLVRDILCRAHSKNKIFRVVVVDSRPKLEGLNMLRYLVKQGIHCSYISINAISYIMKEVSKVILGAHALLSNGCVISRLGNKQIALVASSHYVPVFVCCETYKFCERGLTDSFVHNELGKPEDIITSSLVSNDSLKNWQDLPSFQALNLLYDITSPDLISKIITEKGALPCTSVPVVLRVRYAVLHE